MRGHALHDLHFRLPNSLLRAQKFNVGGADVDDNGHVRSCDLGQVGNFAEMVHAHFQHRDLGILRHGKHRHGHSDVVIVVGRGLTGDESLFQHGSDHFLRGALAHGAGDRHHLCADAFQFFPGDSPQSNAGVVHIDRGVVPHLAAAQSRRSAPVHSLFDEVVAVPRALKRDKQLPRLSSTTPPHHSAACLSVNFPMPFPLFPAGGRQPLPVHPSGALRRRCPDRSHDPFLPE